jgi:hypothetical protein
LRGAPFMSEPQPAVDWDQKLPGRC